jgi:molecular chaperone GrpE
LCLLTRQKEFQYLRADYQTMSRRVQEERAKATDFAIAKFARELVGTTHVLGTALKHTPKPIEKGSALGNLFDGVELTRKSLLQTLAHHGITPMGELVGEAFDPNSHEAIFQVPAAVAPKKSDGSERGPGEIIEVQKEGWMIKERVLVPAQVGVVQME